MRAVNNQRGIALVVALMVLLIISIVGVAAMRSSTFSAKVATGAQLDAIAFEAAESAIVTTFNNLAAINAADDPVVFDQIVELFNSEGQRILRTCGAGDRFDSRGFVQAESRSASTGFSMKSGNQISSSGGGGALFADFTITIQGNSNLVGYGISNRHVQQARRSGMIPGSEIQ